MIDDFEKEIECHYKGETYSVRDNGAVMRHSRVGYKPRPLDNFWTYGKYNKKTGYAEIASERVHRIVATAFLGEAPSPQHVVDHIDTNRRNNRPENLRWITKLENILLNPITGKRIELVCGSIEEFLKDPSKLRQNYVDRDFEWMRAVSKEEAAACLDRLLSWAKSDIPLFGGSLGEWIYRRSLPKNNVETESVSVELPKETSRTTLTEKTATSTKEHKLKPARILKSNPFNFPRPEESDFNNVMTMYRTTSEIFGLLKAQLDSDKRLKLPNIILSTAGKGIVIRESWIEEFQESNCCNGGNKSRIPKYILLRNNAELIALLIRMKSRVDEDIIGKLKSEGYNIVEIDLSWAKHGVTKEEMDYILQSDISKKKWINHNLIREAREKLQNVCEPIYDSGQGVAHSYVACPRISDSVQDIECWYCDYHFDREIVIDGKTCICGCCFGKSGVKTYNDLLSIINVEKEDELIVSISYNNNGNTVTKKFNKEVQLPGKTIFQLWDEKSDNKLIARNIYSDWCILVEIDPRESFEKHGAVYAKLGRNANNLESCAIRPIFGFDSYCWAAVTKES